MKNMLHRCRPLSEFQDHVFEYLIDAAQFGSCREDIASSRAEDLEAVRVYRRSLELVPDGILEMSLVARSGSHEHNRHQAAVQHSIDMVGETQVLLHPSCRGNKVSVQPYNPGLAEARMLLRVPNGTLGGTPGLGTHRRHFGHVHEQESPAVYEVGVDPAPDLHRRRHLDAKRQAKAGKQGPVAAAAVAAGSSGDGPAGAAGGPPPPPPRAVGLGPPPLPVGPRPKSSVPPAAASQAAVMPAVCKGFAPTLAGTPAATSPAAGAAAVADGAAAVAAAAADDTVWYRGYEYWRGPYRQWWWKEAQSGWWHRV